MKKLKTILLCLAVLALPIILITSCQDDDNFTDVVPDTSQAIIRSIAVDGNYADIEHTTATATLTLPSGSDLTAVQIDITTPEGTMVTPESGSVLDFSQGPIVFTTKAANGSAREYTVTMSAYGDPRILSFNIGENQGVINDEAATIDVTIGSEDGDITNLAPNFIIAEGTTVDTPSGVSRNFTNPVTYTVLSDNGYSAREYTVNVTQVAGPKVESFKINDSEGVINNTDNTILVLMPAGTDVTKLSPEIVLPEGQTINPASGTEIDFTEPVNYTVTNTESLTKTYVVTVEVQDANPTLYAFLGKENSIDQLVDDDAKAAAQWMQSQYGDNFIYIPFADVKAQDMAEVKVAMVYYLTSAENLGYQATPDNIYTLLPTELRPGQAQLEVLKNWVKSGGDLLLAGEATPLLFALERVPADFSQPRETGNYVYSEFGCAGSEGCVDQGKPADDVWGLGVRDSNTSENRRNHPVFNNLSFVNDEYLPLQNSATREVRLIWWQHFDGILDPSCCGQDAVVRFEQNFNAIKFGTLAYIGDAFGYGAVLWNRTDSDNDANFDSNISDSFKGNIFSIENTIVGYEWDSNGTVNDYQSNIETFTANILDFLYNLD